MDKLPVAEEYTRYVEAARKLAEEDMKRYPVTTHKDEEQYDRYTKHLIGMLEMHSAREVLSGD